MGVKFDSLPGARRYQWPRYTDDEDVESAETTVEQGISAAGAELSLTEKRDEATKAIDTDLGKQEP